jgi:hypothetical protein
MTGFGPTKQAQIAEAEREYDDQSPLRLLYGGSIVVQLGSQLYPSVTAAVAELISNAWDADARNVWITIPFGDDWIGKDSAIEVLDDGSGMDRRESQFKYLVVGRERRAAEGTDRTPGGRFLHGRKGIGKLAAFGTGRLLEVVTRKAGEKPVGFRLDYEKLRALEPAESAMVEEFDPQPLVTPDGNTLEEGTLVRLANLQVKRRPSRDRFLLSMRRRFSLDESEMAVFINGTRLRRFDLDFQYRFPRDAAPPEATVGDDGLATEYIDDEDETARAVRWWIGFLDQPVKDELLQGISVLVRDKMAQRPFKFERTGGAPSQLGYEYLVGEVHADWIDDGIDDEADLIASNRDTLQLEDPRLQPFIAWGRRRLAWALGERQRLQEDKRVERWSTEIPDLGTALRSVSRREQQTLGRIAERLARIEGLRDADVAEVIQRVVETRENRTAAAIAQEIQALGDAASARTWQLAKEASDIERRTASSVVGARLALLDQMTELLNDDAAPPDLAAILAKNPWLVDLRFDRSAARTIAADDSAGEAVVLIGPPAWDLDAEPTILAAFWTEATRPKTDKAWLAAVEASGEAAGARPLLVAKSEIGFPPDTGLTWTQCLERSHLQHEAWLALVGGK